MTLNQRTILAASTLICALAAQPQKPASPDAPYAADLRPQVERLQKRLDAVEARLKILEDGTAFRISPLSERIRPEPLPPTFIAPAPPPNPK